MKTKIISSLIVILLSVSYFASKFFVGCKNGGETNGGSTDTPLTNTTPPPPVLTHTIVDSFPHDTSFYTQGITFYKGELYEGTGDPGYLGKSRLMKADLKTGVALNKISLSNKFFGEGITILRDTIYQLTWQEHKVFVYTLKEFKQVKEFDITTEG